MAQNFKNVWVGLRFKPVTTLTSDSLGEVQSSSVTNKTYLHNGTSRSPLVTADHAETLTLKTIDADNNTISNLEVDNLKTGVLNTSTTLAAASDLQVPSALAVKTYVDDTFSPQTDVADLVTLSGVPANSTDLGTFTGTTIPDASTIKSALQSLETGLEAHINDTVGAHAASAILVIPTGGISSTDVQAALQELQAEITAGGDGDVDGPASSTDNGIARFDGTTGKAIQNSTVTIDDVGVVANASIDAAANTISGITNTSIAAGAAIAATKIADGSVSNAEFQFLDGVTSNIQTQINGKVGTTEVATLTNKTINAPDNTITNIANVNIAAAAGIARSKLASGTANAVVHNDASGVMSNSADLLVGTNALTLTNTKHLEIQAATDSTTTGANAVLTAFVAGAIRLTNASLTSIGTIPAGTNGQRLTIFNRTGADLTIADSSAAVGTTANRILTGTNGTITFTNNAALVLEYDSTTARWQIVGGTGSGTGSSASLDTILQLTASEQLTDWSTGNNATFLGGGALAGTFVKNTSTPLHGTASYQYTQAAGSLNDYLASVVFPVDIRFRGQQVYFSAPMQYNGSTGDIQIVVYCATTSTVLTTISDSFIGSNGSTQTVIASCVIPLTCTGIRVGLQVKVLNSGKVLAFDDIQVSQSLYQAVQLNNVTDWQAYTPTFTAFGTVTSPEFLWRRVGSDMFIMGKFVTGTTTATEARISLPLGLSTANSTIIPSIRTAEGALYRNTATASNGYSPLLEMNTSYITLGRTANSGVALTKVNGTDFNATETQVISCGPIPIGSWTAGNTAIVTPVQQISSDTIPFTFKATAIVDADPIGTFNTYTYAINTNTATISASAPTQTVVSMNVNGFQVFARAYNTASTTSSPARVDIKIGKGLKAKQVDAYTTALKINPFSYDYLINTTAEQGTSVSYDEVKGILYITGGLAFSATNVTKTLGIDTVNNASPTSGYFVFNASTAPSIAALPVLQPRIAYLKDTKTGAVGGGASSAGVYQTRTLNTVVDSTGIVTSLSANIFLLQAGTYSIEALAPCFVGGSHKIRLRNTTDSTTAILGQKAYTAITDLMQTNAYLSGEFTITTSKSFSVEHFITTANAEGLGVSNASGGDDTTFTEVRLQKIR